MAEHLVNGVIREACLEVRSILAYRKGALGLEEYFYGYDRNRPYQMPSLTKSVTSLLAGAAVDREWLRADEPAVFACALCIKPIIAARNKPVSIPESL